MASIIQTGNKWRAQVRRAGQPVQTKTHDTEKEAKKWAAAIEVEIDSGKRVGIHGKTGVTLAQAIDRYLDEHKSSGRTAGDILRYLRDGMGKIYLEKMTDQDIVNYINSKGFSAASGALHFAFLRTVLKMAKVGWNYHVPDILDSARDRLKILKLIGKSTERDRRPTEDELERLINFNGYPSTMPMGDIIRFAVSSTMRQAEITRIKHSTFNEVEQTIVITDRKHPTKKMGNNKIVPLLQESIDIIKRQNKKEGNDNVFPFPPTYIGNLFCTACNALGIVDLHFHDLRHEGASRLFEMGYKIEEVAMFTGHEDWSMLKRYTHLKAKDIRRLKAVKTEPAKSEPAEMDAETMKQFKQFQAMMAMMKQNETA